MRRSKGLAVLALLAMVLFATGCSQSANTSTSRVEKKTVPFLLQMDPDEDATESEMNLYFIDGGDVPYVAVSEFIPFSVRSRCEPQQGV